MQNLHSTEHQHIQSNFNIKEEVVKYLKHWKWFVFGIFVALLAAFLYLRYTVANYKAVATILGFRIISIFGFGLNDQCEK